MYSLKFNLPSMCILDKQNCTGGFYPTFVMMEVPTLHVRKRAT